MVKEVGQDDGGGGVKFEYKVTTDTRLKGD